MPSWMQRENKEDEVERKIELKPEDMQKALEPHLSKMSTELDSKISPILEFINQQKEDRAQREQEAARTRQRERQVELEVKPEDYLDDPSGAMDKKLQPLIQQNAALAAAYMRRETLEKKEFYDNPDFKAKVDALIDAQPLGSRANPAVIMNCYKSTYFDNLEDIKAGKIKSALSMGGGSNTGGHSADEADKGDKITMNDDERKYARKMGISEENWMKQKRSLEYV